jgi:hypothetical protein
MTQTFLYLPVCGFFVLSGFVGVGDRIYVAGRKTFLTDVGPDE